MDHLCLLLNKECIIAWRSKIWCTVEIAIPLLISLPLTILVIQNSSTIKHEAQFWESFQVTGDWRDIDRRLGNMRSIYSYDGMINKRSLGLVFPNDMDRKEILWVARELESRYLMNNSVLYSHSYKMNVEIFPTEAAMMETLLDDYHVYQIHCQEYIQLVEKESSAGNQQMSTFENSSSLTFFNIVRSSCHQSSYKVFQRMVIVVSFRSLNK